MSQLQSTSDVCNPNACSRVERSTLHPESRDVCEDDAGERVPDSIAALYSTIKNEVLWDVGSVGTLLTEELLALGS